MSAVCLHICRNVSCLFTYLKNISCLFIYLDKYQLFVYIFVEISAVRAIQPFVDVFCRIFYHEKRIIDWSTRIQNEIFFEIFTHCAVSWWGSKACSAEIQHFFSHFSNLLWTTTSCQMIFITIQFFSSACPWTYLASSNNAQWLKFAQNGLTT